MTKEYEAYLAYQKAGRIDGTKTEKPEAGADDYSVYADFLIHYGVKGQKWGTRQWQNADGTYTEAGKHHYGWGYGRQTTAVQPQSRSRTTTAPGMAASPRMRVRSPVSEARRTQLVNARQRKATQAEIEARKARTRKLLKIAAGVAITAAVSYGAYKGYQQSTKLRDNMRADVYKSFDTDSRNLHTLNSKYWDSADRRKYSEMTAKRANDVASSIGRKEAVAAKFYEKTGLRIPTSSSTGITKAGREKVLAQRRSEIAYSNFIRDAEKRGAMNKSIHDARADLKKAQKGLIQYQTTAKIGTSKQYEDFWAQRRQEQVDAARERLNELLTKRRAS